MGQLGNYLGIFAAVGFFTRIKNHKKIPFESEDSTEKTAALQYFCKGAKKLYRRAVGYRAVLLVLYLIFAVGYSSSGTGWKIFWGIVIFSGIYLLYSSLKRYMRLQKWCSSAMVQIDDIGAMGERPDRYEASIQVYRHYIDDEKRSWAVRLYDGVAQIINRRKK